MSPGCKVSRSWISTITSSQSCTIQWALWHHWRSLIAVTTGFQVRHCCLTNTTLTWLAFVEIPIMDKCTSLTEFNIGSNQNLTMASLGAWCASPPPNLETLNIVYCNLTGMHFCRSNTTLTWLFFWLFSGSVIYFASRAP